MNILNKIKKIIKDNDTSILTGVGLVDGLVVGGYLWYKTGIKANNIIKSKEEEKGEKLTFKEKVQCSWKIFIVPCANTLLSATAIILSDKISSKRFAALGAAYNITEATLQKYQDRVTEEFGKNKATEIKDNVTEDIAKQHDDEPIIETGHGNVVIFEPTSCRRIRTNWDKVDNAILKINELASLGDGAVTLSAFYRELGLPVTAISDRIGWDRNRSGRIGIRHTSMLDKNDVPCGAIVFDDLPYEL